MLGPMKVDSLEGVCGRRESRSERERGLGGTGKEEEKGGEKEEAKERD